MKPEKKECPDCGKVIESLYPKQLDYNYRAHLLACKKFQERQESNGPEELELPRLSEQ